jgi:WD40 repeat protein
LSSDVRVWDLSNTKSVISLPEFNTKITSLAFSPDGQFLAVGDRNIHLWHVNTKKFIATLFGDDYATQDIVFRPDGQQIAATDIPGQCKSLMLLHAGKSWILIRSVLIALPILQTGSCWRPQTGRPLRFGIL